MMAQGSGAIVRPVSVQGQLLPRPPIWWPTSAHDDQGSPLHEASRRTIMHFGATMWFTEYSISPSELAVALEERGFESLVGV